MSSEAQTVLSAIVIIVAATAATAIVIRALREVEQHFKTLADDYESLANAAKDQANGLGTFVINQDGKVQFARRLVDAAEREDGE